MSEQKDDSASEVIARFAMKFAPDVLAYLERKRCDRREVFEVAFAVASAESKVELAIAYLNASTEIPAEAIDMAMRKAGMPS